MIPGAEHAEWHAQARRATPLVDGVEYYRFLRKSLLAAQHQVLILGWEIHSEIELLRGDEAARAQEEDGWPVRLADVLLRLVDERPKLKVWILIWEGASIFALERQFFPRMAMPWNTHPRIKLIWDRDTPRMASHHQKLVAIDDAIAFVGGIDLTAARWDDHTHHPGDPRRRVPGLLKSVANPYHDIQMAVEGEIARVVGEWCRERWRRATGEVVSAPPQRDMAQCRLWPPEYEAAFQDKDVYVALTQPDFGGRPEKRQVEQSYLAQIEAAEDLIYLENQYLTCGPIVDALCARLKDPEGPEVILVLPYGCPGVLQSMGMDPQRDMLLDRLRAADPGGRFAVYWATVQGGSTEKVYSNSVYIHAKTMVVDDRLLRIGSANLNYRSMGLDTELDVFLAAGADEDGVVSGICSYRRRLIAYLLDSDPVSVATEEREVGSVIGAIEALRGGTRTLHPFDHRAEDCGTRMSLPIELSDPNGPMTDLDADRVLKVFDAYLVFGGEESCSEDNDQGRRWPFFVLLSGLFLGMTLIWNFSPLRDIVDQDWLKETFESVRKSRAGMAGIVALFIGLATIGFPVSLLIGVSAAFFELFWAVPICVAGVLASGFLDFSLGHYLPESVRQRILSGRVKRAVARLEGRGVLAIAVLRNIPIAPFAVVNIACGIAGLPRRDFLIGTFIGMLPAILVMGFFGQELGRLFSDPTPGAIAKVIVAALLVAALGFGADKAIARHRDRKKQEDDETAAAGEG